MAEQREEQRMKGSLGNGNKERDRQRNLEYEKGKESETDIVRD